MMFSPVAAISSALAAMPSDTHFCSRAMCPPLTKAKNSSVYWGLAPWKYLA